MQLYNLTLEANGGSLALSGLTWHDVLKMVESEADGASAQLIADDGLDGITGQAMARAWHRVEAVYGFEQFKPTERKRLEIGFARAFFSLAEVRAAQVDLGYRPTSVIRWGH